MALLFTHPLSLRPLIALGGPVVRGARRRFSKGDRLTEVAGRPPELVCGGLSGASLQPFKEESQSPPWGAGAPPQLMGWRSMLLLSVQWCGRGLPRGVGVGGCL